MPSSYTVQDLSLILGVSVQAVHKRASKENWKCALVPNSKGGGSCKSFTLDSLPQSVRLAISIRDAEQLAKSAVDDPINTALITTARKRGKKNMLANVMVAGNSSNLPVPFNPQTGEGLNTKDQNKALLMSRLVAEYRDYYGGKTNGAVLRAKKDFVTLYNQGDIGILPSIYSIIGGTSFQTLERWDLKLRRNENNPFELADKRGKIRNGAPSKGQCSITAEQAKIIEAFAYHPNRLLDSEIIRAAVARMKYEGISCTQSEDTFRRHIERLRTGNYADWIFRREGWKALNEKCLFHVTRDYDAIDVGDIVFADGHVMNFECINPWTGKPKRMTLVLFYDMKSNYPLGWEIMPTENTEAIKVALYRAILTLGKKPRVIYLDNGRAFKSAYFTGSKSFREIPEVGLFGNLGMKVIFAWPYHAETKPIEGFFHIFAGLERRAPSYTGTSIENKPARMHRGEAIHRALYDKLYQGKTPTIMDAHFAIAHWIDTEYGVRPQDGHLKGKCPLEVFAAGRGPGLSEADKIQLRLLMAEKHVKKIPRDGFKMSWSDLRYYHPDLFGRQNQAGSVRYDWQDKGRIYVYDASGKFICEATQTRKVHPAAKDLGTDEDVSELARQLEMKAHLAKTVTGSAREFIASQVVPEVQRQIAEICVDDGKIPPGPPLEKGGDIDAPLSAEEAEAALREFEAAMAAESEPDQLVPAACALPAQFTPDWDSLSGMPDMERYETLIEWRSRGVEIGIENKRWMGMYEKTEEYDRFRGYFEDTELKFTLLYGTQ